MVTAANMSTLSSLLELSQSVLSTSTGISNPSFHLLPVLPSSFADGFNVKLMLFMLSFSPVSASPRY